MAIKLKPEELGPELVRRAKKTPILIGRAVKAGAKKSVRRLIKKTPVDLGQMKNSWRVIGDARTTGVLSGGNLPFIVNDAPHAGVIEGGARPHKVNKEGRIALERWAARQLGVGPKQAKAVAAGVIRKLAREGQEGLFIVRDSMEDIRKDFANELVKRMKKAAKKKASKIR